MKAIFLLYVVTAEENQILSTINEVWNIREPIRAMIRSRVDVLREKAFTNINVLREFCSLNGKYPARND